MPAVNRQYPVELLVPDPLSAEITLGGVKIPLTADNNDLLMMQVRAEIAAHALTLGGASLPVTIMDNSEEEPFLSFRLCTAEGKMPVDEDVPASVKKEAEARFAKWQKEVRHQAPRLVPVAQASDRRTAESEGVFTEEMIERARAPRGPVTGAHAAVPEPAPAVVHGDLMAEYEPVASRDEETGTVHVGQPEQADLFRMDTLMTYGKDDDVAQMWWRGALNRYGLKLRPSEDEVAWREAVATMNVPWEGMKKVAVVNERGGAGKTITAAMLAAAFHLGTSWPIAGFDNNESGGNWHKRTGLNNGHRYTSLDLAEFYVQNGGTITRSDLARMGQKHPTDNYALFTAHRPFKRLVEGKRKPETVQMRAVDVSNVYKALDDHNMLCVSDSGNTLGAPNWEQMVEEQNQLVVPVMTSDDRDDGAVETLKVLASYKGRFAQLAANAVVAVSVWHKGDEGLAKEAVERWSPHVREVVVIPHDPHLIGKLQFSSLNRKTQLAYMQLAAAVARGIREDLA